MEKKDWRTRIGTVLNDNRIDILDKDGSSLLDDLEALLEQELDRAREEGRREGWFDKERYNGLTHTLSSGFLFTEKEEEERNNLRRKYGYDVNDNSSKQSKLTTK